MGNKKKMKLHLSNPHFQIDTSFEHTLFMATPLIGEEMKQIDKLNGGSLNHWEGVMMHITVQTLYDLKYLTMRLSGYRNAPTEYEFVALKQGMEYIMHHPH